LSNISIKYRPLWAYLNSSIVLKGGQAYNMLQELDSLQPNPNMYLILGSSHAYRGYDPDIFKKEKITVFNAGSSAQSLECSYVLLRYYANKSKKLILDIYPGTLSKSTEESQLTLIQNSPNLSLAVKFFNDHPQFGSR
jgi:hypothetical protein